ncbi:MAG: hypothetical protein P8Y45_23460 [Exilibacterium sp.]
MPTVGGGIPGGMPSLPSTQNGENSGSSSSRGTSTASSSTAGNRDSSGSTDSWERNRSSGGNAGEPSRNRGNSGSNVFDESPEQGQVVSSSPGGDSNTPSEDISSGERGAESDNIDLSDEPSASGGGTTQSDPSMTASESVAVLEGELDESIASYDGMILRERGYILNRGNQEGSEEALEDGGEQPYDEGGTPYDEGTADNEIPNGIPGTGPSPTRDHDSSGGGYRPDGRSSRPGDYKHSGQAPVPEDIPDGSDDDVVARQIREAAMNEKDPELREKLWEEYRKYKNQSKKE